MKRFFERLTRGLLYREYKITLIKCEVQWSLAPASWTLDMPIEMQELFRSCGVMRSFGQGHFAYAGCVLPQNTGSIWIIGFYGGVIVKAWLKEVE
jgi:hypothetical protein